MNKQIILASVSPRRKQIFKLLGLKFKVADSKYKEVMNQKMRHQDLVRFLALGKAKAAAKKYPRAVIVAADTVVSFKGKAIGKPKNPKQAFLMLKNFSGKAQEVITGLVVLDAASKQVITSLGTSKIYFKKLSDKDITTYVKSGEPYDKAGGYNLQGRGFALIEKIDGDFTNNLGLPMNLLYNALQKLGIKV